MRIKKIIAGVVGIVLVIILLFFVNGLVGNPISKSLASKGAHKYIDENYNDLNLEIVETSYNFKFGSYASFVQSRTSEDTAFSIYADSFGNIIKDDYEFEVANNFTTWRRLDDEMRKIAKEEIGTKLDFDLEHIYISFIEKESDNKDLMKLKRDMELDINNPPLPLGFVIGVYSNDVSYDMIALVAKSAEAILKEQNIKVNQYSIEIIPITDKQENDYSKSISINYFPADKLSEDNLPMVMKEFEEKRIIEYNDKYKK